LEVVQVVQGKVSGGRYTGIYTDGLMCTVVMMCAYTTKEKEYSKTRL
jgi:hypothetical protein